MTEDPSPEVHVHAVFALGDIGRADGHGWHLRSAAAIALGRIGADAKLAVPSLTASLDDMDGDVRVCAIEALGRIGPEAQVAAAGLIERLHDKHAAVRSAAARTLGQIGPGAKAALSALDRLAHDPEDYVQRSRCRSHGKNWRRVIGQAVISRSAANCSA